MRCVNKHHLRILRFTYLKTNNFTGICASIDVLANSFDTFTFRYVFWARKRTKKACEEKTKLHLKLHFILIILCEAFKEN